MKLPFETAYLPEYKLCSGDKDVTFTKEMAGRNLVKPEVWYPGSLPGLDK